MIPLEDGVRPPLRRLRLVHEGGWQVVQLGQRFEFIPPDGPVMVRRRWGEWRRAA